MTQPHENGIANRMLRSLPQATFERILPALEPLSTVRGQILCREDTPIEHLYFINRGLISLVKITRDGRTAQIGAVGIEGVTHPNAFLTGMENTITDIVVQIPGTVFRIRSTTLRHEMEKDDALHEMMLKYARFALSQLAQNAACNRLHSIKERCCRLLLKAHDSAVEKTFPLTHEFLAMMLGVQRGGISLAASFLQKAELIQYTRGRVTITNRSGLEDEACECYGVLRAELENLFGAPQRG